MIEYFVFIVLFCVSSCVIGFTIGSRSSDGSVLLIGLFFIALSCTFIITEKVKDSSVAEYYVAKSLGYEMKVTDTIDKLIKNRIKKISIEIEKDIVDEKYKDSK